MFLFSLPSIAIISTTALSKGLKSKVIVILCSLFFYSPEVNTRFFFLRLQLCVDTSIWVWNLNLRLIIRHKAFYCCSGKKNWTPENDKCRSTVSQRHWKEKFNERAEKGLKRTLSNYTRLTDNDEKKRDNSTKKLASVWTSLFNLSLAVDKLIDGNDYTGTH